MRFSRASSDAGEPRGSPAFFLRSVARPAPSRSSPPIGPASCLDGSIFDLSPCDNGAVGRKVQHLGCGVTAGVLLGVLCYAAPQSSALSPDAAWFTDQAEAVGIDFVHVNGMSGELYIGEIMAPGAAMFDFDNDGDLDIYLVQGQMLGPGASLDEAVLPPQARPLTDRLYRNDLDVRADGTRTLRFMDVTEESGLDVASYGMGVAAGDIDNDGWVDLYRTSLGPNQLFRNNGDGTFTDVSDRTTGEPRWSVSASFVDIDRDGWLDLYVGNYVDHRLDLPQPECFIGTGERDYCGPKAYTPVPDQLYHNRGDGTFVDVMAEAQVAGEYGPALGVVAADVNGDGWADIYVANDSEPNQLWINQQDGSFTNGALLAGVAFNADGRTEGSMGVDAGDVDADGDDDLFMTHLTTETNTLYINDGSGLFQDGTARAGLGAPSVAYTGFGTAWLDVDNDGWLDLLVVNGAVQATDQRFAIRTLDVDLQPGESLPLHQPNQLFRNRGTGRFEEVTGRAGAAFELSEVSRGAAFGDVDNDGDQDVLVTNNNGRARLLINNVGHHNRWIGLRLVGGPGPRDMLGARVGVFRDVGPTLWRRARADGSYASANDPRVLVGLGEAATVPRVRVIWPSGREEEWTDIALNQWLTLTEGTGRSQ